MVAACGAVERSDRPEVGAAVPSFQAGTLTGDTLALADLRGEPFLLNIWATWCGPCRFETPFLQSVYEEFQEDGLRVVGVSVDQRGSREAIEAFLAEHGVTYDQLHDPSMAAMDTFYVLGLPATFLVDREGVIRLVRMGPVAESDQEFLRTIRELVS